MSFATSTIEISKRAVANNRAFLKDFLGNGVKISSVVKGNAYGHGMETYVPVAESCGYGHFSVFGADEALQVHKVASENTGIMIMGYIDNPELEWAVENDISFFVFDRDRVEAAVKAAGKIGKKAKIHLEVETGMNRTGFNEEQLKEVISLIKLENEYLEVEGVCTHYAGAESIANYLRVNQQITSFNKYEKQLKESHIEPSIRHTACSAASMVYPLTRMDMVRIGIMQYGFWPSAEVFVHYKKEYKKTDPLQRVISWKSKIMTTKDVEAGEFIGYGTSYLAHDDMKIAVVPVGYSHGYNRNLSNQGHVLVHGQKCKMIGVVNMSLMMIDVTHLQNVKKGDEVVLIGNQGEETITVASFGEMSNQLNYELLTRMPSNIPRIVVD